MKKFLTIVMVFTLVLSMGVTAFATTPPSTMTAIELDKEIEMTGVVGENFSIEGEYTLQFGTGSVTPAAGQTVPTLADVTSLNGEFSIPLDAFEDYGVYTYEFTEASGDTAGMTYDNRILVLTIYVTTDGTYATIHDKDVQDKLIKVDSIDNEFDADKLDIKKVVTGNMGELDRYFEVDVTLYPVDDIIKNDITITGGSNEDNPGSISAGNLSVTLKIKHDETITLQNIPEGVTYTVVETTPGDGYEVPDYDWNEAGDEVTITNNRNTDINTGINLDNLPYVIILVGAALGLAGFTVKKRLSNEE